MGYLIIREVARITGFPLTKHMVPCMSIFGSNAHDLTLADHQDQGHHHYERLAKSRFVQIATEEAKKQRIRSKLPFIGYLNTSILWNCVIYNRA